VRLGIIGCGAIAEFSYLPAARKVPDAEVVALVDKEISRARRLGDQYGIATCIDDYRQLPSDIDGVIIALPHDLHASVASEFLQRGTAVLVEKPLALTRGDAEKIIELARGKKVLLQVGRNYRFCHRAQMVKRAIDQNWIGNLRSFVLEGNFADTNPMATGFAWDRKQAGGGTLVDVGSLILDLLVWWFGKPTVVEYRDDSLGGVECECEIDLVFQNAHGSITGKVILSRLRKLRDIIRIDADRLSIVYGFETNQGLLELIPADRKWGMPFVLDTRSLPYQTNIDFFAKQLENFIAAIRSPGKSMTSADDVLPSLELVEECYRLRQSLNFPWEANQPSVAERAA
jgi:predicted dehydrogenase